MVISSLVLLFNLFALNFSAQAEISNDQAIFRLGGQVYFLSDLKNSQKSLKTLSCLSGKAILNKYLEVDWASLKDLDLSLVIQSEKGKSRLLPFVSLERLKNSVLSREKENLSNDELKLLGKKCARKEWDLLDINDKAILLMEVYLRDRFSKSESKEQSLKELKKGLRIKDKHEFLSLTSSDALKALLKETLVEENSKKELMDQEGASEAPVQTEASKGSDE